MITHKQPVICSREGFTIIELIVYMALFSLVIGGLLLTTYSIIESNSKLQSKVLISEEGAFLLRKIDWALNGATDVSVIGTQELVITNPNVGNSIFEFDPTNKKIDFTRAGNTAPINSGSVEVADVVFSYDVSLRMVEVQLTLKNIAESQVFKTTKYLR